MKSIHRRLSALLMLLFTFLVICQGQTYNLNNMPPLDPKVRTGVLDNGMHYFIVVNKIPENRAEFYIAHNVGAIEEDDDQNGLAHFTEHMAFNGTASFPKKGILDYLATIGVKFGTNVNAGTGVEQTVYMLTNVPLKREGITDTCLLILHDWSNYISFEPEEVELERGVILEEWRMYGTASERMDNKLAPVIYKGSKYAKRNVIGDTAVIKHFPRETIVRFYHKWYRPDLQAVIVVGDFDANVMEAKIKKLFSAIPKVMNPAPKEIYPLPDNKEPLIGTATDKEATSTNVDISFKFDATPDNEKNLGYMRTQLVRGLISSMLRQRLSELSRKPDPPFINAWFYYGSYVKSKDVFSGMAQAANNEALKALTALLTEAERMKQYGFGEAEFGRAKADLLRSYESRYMDRDKRKNREFVYPLLGYFLRNNPDPGIEFDYAFAQKEVPGITLDEVNAMAKGFIRDDNQVITVTGPDKKGITLPSEAEIKNVLDTYKNAPIEPWVDNLAGKSLIGKEPVRGKVARSFENVTFGTTEWTLSNGIRVIFKPTDIKEDELLIRGFADGGSSLLEDDMMPSAAYFGQVISEMGTGNFSRTDLSKLLAGKRVSLTMYLSDDQENISVRTSPKDVETALQLLYLGFTQPRWNEADYSNWLEKTKSMLINAASEPRKAFYDTIAVMMTNHSLRGRPMNYDLLKEVSLEKIRDIFQKCFTSPGNFTFIVTGNVNPEEIKNLVEQYMASLPAGTNKDTYIDRGVRPPKGRAVNEFRRESKTPRTAIYVNYNGTCGFSADDRLLGAAMRHVLELRYIQSIREDEGGAYSIRVTFNLNKTPEPNYQLAVRFETDPEKAEKLLGIVHKKIQELIENGPSEEDLQKAKEYFLKQRPEDMKENNWWLGTLADYYSDGIDWLNGYEDKVQKLTVNDIREFAKQTLMQGNIVEVVMKP